MTAQSGHGQVERARDDRGSDEANRVFVGLGGNEGDRVDHLRRGARALATAVPQTEVYATSAIYETRPVGPSSEPFLNAAVELRTRLPPPVLMEQLLAIEARHGRVRHTRWGARTLDLDLLLVLRPSGSGGFISHECRLPSLTLPHPRMTERDFVLVPLYDLTAEEPLVAGQTARWWLERLAAGQRTILRRLDLELWDASVLGFSAEAHES